MPVFLLSSKFSIQAAYYFSFNNAHPIDIVRAYTAVSEPNTAVIVADGSILSHSPEAVTTPIPRRYDGAVLQHGRLFHGQPLKIVEPYQLPDFFR